MSDQQQLAMFGEPSPRTRMIDPATGLPKSTLSEQQAAVLEAVVAHPDGANAWQVQTWLTGRGLYAPDTNVCGSRFNELTEAGWVVQGEDRPGRTGRPQHSYIATAEGRRRLVTYLERAA